MFFLYNVGSMALAILSLPVMAVILFLLKPFRSIHKVLKWHNKLRRFIKYNHCITVVFETYTILAICSLINIHYVSAN